MARIIQSRAARADLDEIWSYIASDDVAAADRFLDEIDRVIRTLATHPGLGRPRPELPKNLRSFPVGNYAIFYHSLGDGVNVYRVLHNARYIDILL